MTVSYYMRFGSEERGQRDRTGGLPTHLPDAFPVCEDTGMPMAFLLQIYTDSVRLPIDGVLCFQLYQCVGVDEGEDPAVCVKIVRDGAPLNESNMGVVQPFVKRHCIEWEERDDPSQIPMGGVGDESVLQLYASKIGGAIPFIGLLPSGIVPIFMIREEPAGFNFAGLVAIIYQGRDGGFGAVLV